MGYWKDPALQAWSISIWVHVAGQLMIFTVYFNSRDQHKKLGKKCGLLGGRLWAMQQKTSLQHTSVTSKWLWVFTVQIAWKSTRWWGFLHLFLQPFEGFLRTEGWLIPIWGLVTMANICEHVQVVCRYGFRYVILSTEHSSSYLTHGTHVISWLEPWRGIDDIDTPACLQFVSDGGFPWTRGHSECDDEFFLEFLWHAARVSWAAANGRDDDACATSIRLLVSEPISFPQTQAFQIYTRFVDLIKLKPSQTQTHIVFVVYFCCHSP